jgi:hypothetical protein
LRVSFRLVCRRRSRHRAQLLAAGRVWSGDGEDVGDRLSGAWSGVHGELGGAGCLGDRRSAVGWQPRGLGRGDLDELDGGCGLGAGLPRGGRPGGAVSQLLGGQFEHEDEGPLGRPVVVVVYPDAHPELVVEPVLSAVLGQLTAQANAERAGAGVAPGGAAVQGQPASSLSTTHRSSR